MPEEVAAPIVQSRLAPLAKQIAAAIEQGHPDRILPLFDAFNADLLATVQRERASGRLKPPTNGVDERLDDLARHGKGPAEIASLRLIITAADPLAHVDFFFVATKSGRRITVEDMRAYGRPAGWSNDSSWRSRFVSDERLRAIEAEAAKSANPQPAYGRNLDFPGGVRPEGFLR